MDTLTFNGVGFDEMKEFLEEKYLRYNQPEFIENDPVSIPHLFSEKQDIEISAFLTSTIAWGRRDQIIFSSRELVKRMGMSPYDFLMSSDDDDLEAFSDFYYRTFQGQDCIYFLKSLKRIYSNFESIEDILIESFVQEAGMKRALTYFRSVFFNSDHLQRTEKHFADVNKGAAGKRLNMFFRWMLRNDNRGVDFGLWERIPASDLYIPLDVHSGNIARKLGLLKRKGNDWKAVEELTEVLRLFDNNDPVKYDFALFGLGVNEEF